MGNHTVIQPVIDKLLQIYFNPKSEDSGSEKIT